jgi:hypothetical protein
MILLSANWSEKFAIILLIGTVLTKAAKLPLR